MIGWHDKVSAMIQFSEIQSHIMFLAPLLQNKDTFACSFYQSF
jgi:hypothetical protein